MQRLWDRLLGSCLRELPAVSPPRLFLTFDDGPSPPCTEAVLRVLERHRARATFFLIAEKAVRQRELVRAIGAGGHTVGDHSLDHRFGPFFARDATLIEWVRRSEGMLSDVLGAKPVGFRAPAGVRTPPLGRALRALGLPLVHWSVRFFDTRRQWRPEVALASLSKIRPGAIVLLHDTHEGTRRERFLETLDRYLEEGTRRGFRFDCLRADEVAQAYAELAVFRSSA